jgi:hypothetical protein
MNIRPRWNVNDPSRGATRRLGESPTMPGEVSAGSAGHGPIVAFSGCVVAKPARWVKGINSPAALPSNTSATGNGFRNSRRVSRFHPGHEEEPNPRDGDVQDQRKQPEQP